MSFSGSGRAILTVLGRTMAEATEDPPPLAMSRLVLAQTLGKGNVHDPEGSAAGPAVLSSTVASAFTDSTHSAMNCWRRW